MTQQSATHAYVGFNEAGEARAIVIDTPRDKKDTARRVAEWIGEGRTVERLPIEEARKRFSRRNGVLPTGKE